MKTEVLPEGVLAQRQEGVYSISPRVALGRITPDQLNIINSVVQEFGLPGVRVTAGQRLKLQGVPAQRLDEILRRLGPVGQFCKYYVQACSGTSACRLAMQDALAMGAKLEEFLNTFSLPAKIKAGVSGCSMCCSESFVRDIGLVGKKHGWSVVFGGNAGKRVRVGDELAANLDDEEALRVIGAALGFYVREAKMRERTARFVERVGVEAIRESVG
ncbi:nitrite reductase [Pseudodesulfovibrio sp. F-1]|uniref:Nitrite reductase n=1 Tax=Pseudodesulfovibrio alkaliphilus TaxID=2661613 RepID=A0A7K1KR83_9BACT|nr:nitrite reductase [Pseudodesulfovibrio alkaliphilus]MUM78422.1 nitrite reductase [Pseudodesulfovibrio alkaliphilus]